MGATMRNAACHSEGQAEALATRGVHPEQYSSVPFASLRAPGNGEQRRAQGDIEPTADPLPDYFEYCDRGCDLFPACLKCPLPRCRYDEQAGGRRAATRLRDKELLRQRRLAGKSIAELAESFGVSKRTVQRIIRSSTLSSTPRGNSDRKEVIQ